MTSSARSSPGGALGAVGRVRALSDDVLSVPGNWPVAARTATVMAITASAVPPATARPFHPRPATRSTAYARRSRGSGTPCVSSSRTRARLWRTAGRVIRSRESLRSRPWMAGPSGPARSGVRNGSRSTPFSVASGRSRSRYGGRPSTIV
ncbi:hypothetical protein [Streptomyces phaeoluteigriseus]|uniref:hypothetical protein n=1 Tax=Streptomyces phaeoluteigriseus TaxID=114686 RepID=UPI001FEBE62A|nr:hypothetical protein [Streptomyces phaeoluteigriseus]